MAIQTGYAKPRFLKPLAGTTQFDQRSIAPAVKPIYGHKRMPRQGRFVGAGWHTKKTMSA